MRFSFIWYFWPLFLCFLSSCSISTIFFLPFCCIDSPVFIKRASFHRWSASLGAGPWHRSNWPHSCSAAVVFVVLRLCFWSRSFMLFSEHIKAAAVCRATWSGLFWLRVWEQQKNTLCLSFSLYLYGNLFRVYTMKLHFGAASERSTLVKWIMQHTHTHGVDFSHL